MTIKPRSRNETTLFQEDEGSHDGQGPRELRKRGSGWGQGRRQEVTQAGLAGHATGHGCYAVRKGRPLKNSKLVSKIVLVTVHKISLM